MPRIDLATHNGILTLRNPKTDTHRTFRVWTQPKHAKFAPGRRVVYLLTGPDNEHDYTPFGFINDRGCVSCWQKHRGTKYEQYAMFLSRIDQVIEQHRLEVNFEGRCRVCNRALTTPESVASGIGPICAERVRAEASV